jgi:hypothetical protein
VPDRCRFRLAEEHPSPHDCENTKKGSLANGSPSNLCHGRDDYSGTRYASYWRPATAYGEEHIGSGPPSFN